MSVEDHIKTAYIGGECLAFVLPEVTVQLEQQLAAVTAELAEFRRQSNRWVTDECLPTLWRFYFAHPFTAFVVH